MNKKKYGKVIDIKIIVVLCILSVTLLTGCTAILNNSKTKKYPESQAIKMAKDYIKDKYSENLEIRSITSGSHSTALGAIFDGYIIEAKGDYYIRMVIKDESEQKPNEDKEVILQDTKQLPEIEAAINEYLEGNPISKDFYIAAINVPVNEYNESLWDMCSNGFTEKYSYDIKLFLNREPNHDFNFYFKDDGHLRFKEFSSRFEKIKNDLHISASAAVLNSDIYEKFMEELKNGNESINKTFHKECAISNYFDNYYFTKYEDLLSNNLINYSNGIQVGLLENNISSINPKDIDLKMIKLSEKEYSIDVNSEYEILSDIYQFDYLKDKGVMLNVIIDSKKLFPDMKYDTKILLGKVREVDGKYIISPNRNYSFDDFNSNDSNDVFVDGATLSACFYEDSPDSGFILLREK